MNRIDIVVTKEKEMGRLKDYLNLENLGKFFEIESSSGRPRVVRIVRYTTGHPIVYFPLDVESGNTYSTGDQAAYLKVIRELRPEQPVRFEEVS